MRILSEIYLTLWAAWQLARTMRAASARAQAALATPEIASPRPLADAARDRIRRRADALQRLSRLWPSRIQCVQRSYALWEWAERRGFNPTMEVGWLGRKAHAWVRIGKEVVNDHQSIGEQWISMRRDASDIGNALQKQERHSNHLAWWAMTTAAIRSQLQSESIPETPVANTRSWDGFFPTIDKWGAGPAVDAYLARHPQLVPENIFSQVSSRAVTRASRQTAVLSELVELVNRLRAGGVDYVYMKGFSLTAAADIDLLTREMADLDFLVPENQLETAHRVLTEAGYLPQVPVEDVGFRRLTSMIHHEVKYKSPRAILPVELHWRVGELKFMRQMNTDFFHNRTMELMIGGNPVITLDKVALTLLSALHGSRHFWAAPKWIADVVLLSRRLTKIEQDELIRVCQAAGSLHVLSAAFKFAHNLLAIELPPFASELAQRPDRRRDELTTIWMELSGPGDSSRISDAALRRKATQLACPDLVSRIRWRASECVSPDFPLLEQFPAVNSRPQVVLAKLRRRYF